MPQRRELPDRRTRLVPTLRVLSYNVRSLRDDEDAVVRVIQSAQAHVVAIQEAPRFGRWRWRRAALARRVGLVVVTGDRPAGANLLLSSLAVDVDATRDLAFSVDRGLHRRGAALAVLRWRGQRFVVAGIHLDLVAEPRLRHVGELKSAVSALAGPDLPVIVLGDVNDLPGSSPWQALTEFGDDAWARAGVGDGNTYSARTPVRRIDAVFADRRLSVRSATVLDSEDVRVGSDHRPLLVELELPAAG
jgi:endonuclease/exonuclease/phosphatase family metal-dependent hydrolase